MGSRTPLRLPMIDFTMLGKSNTSLVWDSLKNQVHEAFRDYGCFEAVFDGIPVEVEKSIFGSLEQLFDLPLETKQKNVSDMPFQGYLGSYPNFPLYESMGIPEAHIPEKAQTFTNLMWPRGNPDFCENIRTFSTRLSELDRMVRRMIVESLGLEKYWDEHIDITRYLLRVMKYKDPETTEPAMGLKAHTDKNMVTILHQNHVGGLEIETKSGEWIKVKPSSSNSFIVMASESLHAWTNGRVHAPYHRVVMSGTEARFSLGLFAVPKGGIRVKVPDEMVDEKHPLLFNPFDYGEFMKFYTARLGELNDKQYALTSYCGVV